MTIGSTETRRRQLWLIHTVPIDGHIHQDNVEEGEEVENEEDHGLGWQGFGWESRLICALDEGRVAVGEGACVGH